MKMTSRERLDRCFRHLETDRPGLFIRGVNQQYPAHESYAPLRKLVTEECDLKTVLYMAGYKDQSKVSYRVEGHSEDFERHVMTVHTPAGDLERRWMAGLKGNPGYTEKHLLDTPEDAEKYLTLPDESLIFDPEIFFQADREMGDRGVVVAEMGLNPAGMVAEHLGSEKFALWSIEHRELICTLMEKEMNVLLKNVKQLIDMKIGPYFALLGEEYITPPLHGPRDFYDFNVVYDKPIADLIHNAGGLLHIHSHGPLKGLLPYFIELGADVLHPIEAPPMGNVTIGEAKEILKGKVCIEGNVQIGDMYKCTSAEIREMVQEVIREAFYDSKGLIVCPTASPYIPVIDARGLENYHMLIETVLQYEGGARR